MKASGEDKSPLHDTPKYFNDTKHYSDIPRPYPPFPWSWQYESENNPFDKIGPVKFDGPESMLPFALSTPHHYAPYLSAEQQHKVSSQMYDYLIQQTEYQITMLKARQEALTKLKEQLKEANK